MRKPLYVSISGGLGNQLFMFATALSLSVQWSRRLILIDSWYEGYQRGEAYAHHRRTFNLLEFPAIAKNYRVANRIENKLISFLENIHFSKRIDLSSFGFQNLDEIAPGESVKPKNFLYGYMQEPVRFLHAMELMRDLLQLPEEEQVIIKEHIRKKREGAERLIAVHVRRGDYAHPEMFGCLLTGEYFKNALGNFDLNRSKVLIFSDSPEWCEQDSFLGQFEVVKESSATISLIMMSLCDDFIVSPSTFSWWGAQLGKSQGKRVVAPRPYNEFNSETWEQLVNEDWIREPAIFEKL